MNAKPPASVSISIRAALVLATLAISAADAAPLAHPIAFVTAVPPFTTFGSSLEVFGNHQAGIQEAPRGGDLMILYPDGTLRNLTQEAGYGSALAIMATPGNTDVAGYPESVDPKGQFGGIAVRDPEISWNGDKIIFSMTLGGPNHYQVGTYRWQLYEASGLAKGQTAVISKVPKQPPFNNVQPTYLSDGRILFASDRPRGALAHHYPQRDEYESAPVTAGLYALDPQSGALTMMTHAPSGDFNPIVAADGRIVFTRWDHLIRDQQADADHFEGGSFGSFTYADESASAARLPLDPYHEVFPEPRQTQYAQTLYPGANLNGHAFNFFMPWQLNQDGTDLEILNHMGRHELLGYFERSLLNDPALVDFNYQSPVRPNQNATDNFHQIRELPNQPGDFIGVRATEFGARAAGQLIYLRHAQIGLSAELMRTSDATHPDTFGFNDDADPPRPNDSGKYRNPMPLANGDIVAAHSPETRTEVVSFTDSSEIVNGQSVAVTFPAARYQFRLRMLAPSSVGLVASGAFLTSAGIHKTLAFWSPDVLVRFNNFQLWELDPVEIRPRAVPPLTAAGALASQEQSRFDEAGVQVEAFRTFLRQNNAALIVVRNATTRDSADRQQPFNLAIPGGVSTISPQPVGAKVYSIDKFQVFQDDAVRGYGGVATPGPGRRLLARPLHDTPFKDLQVPGLAGAYPLFADGSAAVIVPANRALSWQTLAPDGTPVVRERLWVSFQPGEIRMCTSCHGLNSKDQAGHPKPTNSPLALKALLARFNSGSGALFQDGFE